MRTRKSMMAKVKIDYDYEASRPMCIGCNKLFAGGRILTGYKCMAYLHRPSMYVRADECPMNPRIRPVVTGKVRVGQGRTKQGGNR